MFPKKEFQRVTRRASLLDTKMLKKCLWVGQKFATLQPLSMHTPTLSRNSIDLSFALLCERCHTPPNLAMFSSHRSSEGNLYTPTTGVGAQFLLASHSASFPGPFPCIWVITLPKSGFPVPKELLRNVLVNQFSSVRIHNVEIKIRFQLALLVLLICISLLLWDGLKALANSISLNSRRLPEASICLLRV